MTEAERRSFEPFYKNKFVHSYVVSEGVSVQLRWGTEIEVFVLPH